MLRVKLPLEMSDTDSSPPYEPIQPQTASISTEMQQRALGAMVGKYYWVLLLKTGDGFLLLLSEDVMVNLDGCF